MHTYTFNGQARDADSALKTWGELLQHLEPADSGDGRPVVTAVRFNGVDEPSFREPAACARALEELSRIDVECVAADTLIASTLQTALEGLTPLADGARLAARAFRRHDLASADRDLGELTLALQSLITLTRLLAHARGLHAAVFESDARLAEPVRELRDALESLVACRERRDWLSLADVLEIDVAGALTRWTTVLERLALEQPAGSGAVS